MDNSIMVMPQAFGQVPAHLQKTPDAINEMAEGIGGGFGIISYRGKVWRTKHRGEEQAMMREDGSGPKASIQVVVVKSASNLSKIYFEQGYVEGSNAAPDCFSTNGIVPDPAANKKQARACGGCPKNAWGSRVSEAGKQGKACGDSKRLAVVPAGDLKNEAMGGPMLLRVPAASLQDMVTFTNMMFQQGFQYNTYVMDISFDINDAYPKFVFKAVRPLPPDEYAIVKELGDGPVAQRILVEAVDQVTHDVAVPAQATETLPEAVKAFAPSKPNGATQPAAQQAPTQTSAKNDEHIAAERAIAEPKEPLFKTDKQFEQQVEMFPPGAVGVGGAAQPPDVTQQVTQRPKFDAQTGKPIVYPEDKPAPAQVQVPPLQKAASPPAETQPSTDAVVTGAPGFDEALDAMLAT